jgi:hypothetical protein
MPALPANMRWTSMRCASVVAAFARVLQSDCSLVESFVLAQSCVRFIAPLVDEDPLVEPLPEVAPEVVPEPLVEEEPPAVPRLVLPLPAVPDVSGPVEPDVDEELEVPVPLDDPGPLAAANAAVLSTTLAKTVPMIFNRMKCAPVVRPC